jgi:hypothetical protein
MLWMRRVLGSSPVPFLIAIRLPINWRRMDDYLPANGPPTSPLTVGWARGWSGSADVAEDVLPG